MSTIAYRDGVMAADTRAYSGRTNPIGKKIKIRRLDSGTLIGCSTRVPGLAEALFNWYTSGADLNDGPSVPDQSFAFLAVTTNGLGWFANDAYVLSGPLEADYFAIGSGAEAALGAMFVGADAILAIEAAASVDPWTATPITALSHFEGSEKKRKKRDKVARRAVAEKLG